MISLPLTCLEIGEFEFALGLTQKVFDTPEPFSVFLDPGLVSPNFSNKTLFDLPLVGLGLVSEEAVILSEGAHKKGLVFPGLVVLVEEWNLAFEVQDKLMFLNEEIFLPLNEKPGLCWCPLPRPVDREPPRKGLFPPSGKSLDLGAVEDDGFKPVKTDSDFFMALVSFNSLDSNSSPNKNLLDDKLRSFDWFLRISLTLILVSIKVDRTFSLRW